MFRFLADLKNEYGLGAVFFTVLPYILYVADIVFIVIIDCASLISEVLS